MKVGVFGGTFDPIHLGHLRMATEIREKFVLDTITLIPCNWPPHKPGGPGASSGHRLEMARLAAMDDPGIGYSDIELVKGGTSYTVDTLQALQGPGQELFFVLGLDAFLEIHTWKEYRDLFGLAHFIVMARPWSGKMAKLFHVEQYVKNYLQDVVPGSIHGSVFPPDKGFCGISFAQTTALEISATLIRELVKSGKSIQYLVPPAVQDYIASTRIYI